MSCTPPRNSRNTSARAFPSRPGVRNVIYPPRRNNPNGRLVHLRPNNAATCTGTRVTGGERVLEPLSLSSASLAGSGSLRGFSGYRPTDNTQDGADTSAPWNAGPVRKWLSRSLSGFLRAEFYTETGLGGDLICFLAASFPLPGAASYGDAWSGTVSIDPVTGAYSSFGSAVARDYGAMPWTGACAITNGAPGNVTGLDGNGYNSIETYSLTTRTRTGSGYAEPAIPANVQWRSRMETGLATETLSSPDSEYAAIARAGGGVAGVASEAVSGVSATTGPASLDPLPFTDAVAVRASADFGGIAPGLSYELRAVYRARPLGGGYAYTFGAAAPVTVSGAWRETLAHDLPLVPLHAVSLVSLQLVAL